MVWGTGSWKQFYRVDQNHIYISTVYVWFFLAGKSLCLLLLQKLAHTLRYITRAHKQTQAHTHVHTHRHTHTGTHRHTHRHRHTHTRAGWRQVWRPLQMRGVPKRGH
jgi:ABC-type nickel/cobalt efflux system permease component RcnA